MSHSAALVTSDVITNADLAEWIESIGGDQIPNECYRFVVTEGDSNVWISIQDEVYFSINDEKTTREWTRLLGGTPKSEIELNLDHSDGSLVLYLDIAYKLSKKWNSILIDIDDVLVPGQEIEQRYYDARDGAR